MLNNFIYAQTKELFLNALNNEQVLDEAIVFIEDTKEIWNRGHYFGGGIDEDIITNIQTSIANLDATKLSKAEADGLYVLKEDIPDLEDYVTQSWIESNYLPLTGGTLTGMLTSNNIVPYDDGACSLGSASRQWTTVFAEDFEASNSVTAPLGEFGNLGAQSGVFTDLLPPSNNPGDIGGNSRWWSNVYATTINSQRISAESIDAASDDLTLSVTDHYEICFFDNYEGKFFARFGYTGSHIYTALAVDGALTINGASVATQTWVGNNYLSLTGGTISDDLYVDGLIEAYNIQTDSYIDADGYVKAGGGLLTNEIDVIDADNTLLFGKSADQITICAQIVGGEWVSSSTFNESWFINNLTGEASFKTYTNLPTASTSKSGIVTLSSATNSTSTSLAATASAVKAAYDLAASKTANTGTVTSITVQGTGALGGSGTVTSSGTISITHDTLTPTDTTVAQTAIVNKDNEYTFLTDIEFDSYGHVNKYKKTTYSFPINAAGNSMSTATSVTSVPVTYNSCKCTVSASGSFSLASTPAKGRCINVLIYNSGSSSITITMPTSSTYVNLGSDSLTIAAGGYGEINAFSDGSKIYLRNA